jgi:hypothetical protein
MAAARRATTADEVEAIRSELDEIVGFIMSEGARGDLDANQIAALSLGLGRIRDVLTGHNL